MATALHDELADGNLARLFQCIADHDIAFISLITIGDEVTGLLPIAAINLVLIHELLHVDGVLGFEL